MTALGLVNSTSLLIDSITRGSTQIVFWALPEGTNATVLNGKFKQAIIDKKFELSCTDCTVISSSSAVQNEISEEEVLAWFIILIICLGGAIFLIVSFIVGRICYKKRQNKVSPGNFAKEDETKRLTDRTAMQQGALSA